MHPFMNVSGRLLMKLVEDVVDDITVLEAYGRLDSTTAKEFGDRLNALVQAGQSSIVVDLKNIAKTEQARALRRDWRSQAVVRDWRLHQTVCDLPDAGGRDRPTEAVTGRTSVDTCRDYGADGCAPTR